jgi:hypothetical protein
MMLSPVVPAYEFYKFVFLRAGAGCREGMTTVRQNVEGAGMHKIALGTLYFRTGINAATVVRHAGASNGEDRSWPHSGCHLAISPSPESSAKEPTRMKFHRAEHA